MNFFAEIPPARILTTVVHISMANSSQFKILRKKTISFHHYKLTAA